MGSLIYRVTIKALGHGKQGMLNVIMLSAVTLSVVMLSAVMLSVLVLDTYLARLY